MEIFKFGKEDITRYIEYELRTLEKFREPLNYVIKSLEKAKHCMVIKSLDSKINLNKVKERKGKNYHWSVFHYKNATLVVRRYHQHLTIFTKVNQGENRFGEAKVEYGAFTLNTDFEKFGDKHDEMMDKYYDKPFLDLNVIVKNLFKLLLSKGGSVHWVWNSATLSRPDHVKIKLIFSGNSINSIDDFAFCMEELESTYLELFAETTTLKVLKGLKSGDKIDERYAAGKIITDVKDNYYHGVGMEVIHIGRDKKNFEDVYSLTRWYFEDMFKEMFYLYDGEVYVKGEEFKVGEPVAYKNIKEDNVTLFKDTMPKENFIPLKKY